MEFKVLCTIVSDDAVVAPAGPSKARCGNTSKTNYSTRKIVLRMKLVILLTTLACLQAWSNGHAQDITLSVKNAPLEKVFKEIRKQSQYTFIYTKEELAGTLPVTLEVKAIAIELVLEICFRQQPLTYMIEENHIVVKKKKESVIVNPSGVFHIDIKGRVVNENNQPVEGVSVKIKGANTGTSTDVNGFFELKDVDENAVLVFSGVNVEIYEIKVNGKTDLTVTLKTKVVEDEGVSLQANNGFQVISKVTAAGSYDLVNKELLNRRVSTNILDRIENLTPGLSFKTPGEGAVDNQSGIIIRGRSSIYSSVAPLIVLDNFPYDGNINNINPADVESITILKDASAASIWGARAGNGVIVITTKRGKSGKPQIEINTNITFRQRPDIFNVNTISGADYIDLEKYLFSKNYYSLDELYNQFRVPNPFTPVVDLLIAKREGTIPAVQADAQIEGYKKYDARNDISRYLYRNSVNQQYSVNINGATSNVNYYMSAGWDHSLSNLVGAESDRITLRTQNSFKITSRLKLDAGINFTQSNNKSGNNPGYGLTAGNKGLYPYAQLVNAQGQSLELIYNMRKIFTDTAVGGGKLLDWKYRPRDDIGYSKNTDKIRDYLVNMSIRYEVTKGLVAELKYQYENSINTVNNLYGESSFFARNLINSFFQPNAANQFPVPGGAILDVNNSEIISHQGRAQLNYNKTIHQKHQVSAIAGWEIKDVTSLRKSSRFYGYREQGSLVNSIIDYTTPFTQYNNIFGRNFIPNPQDINQTLDRFISYYANSSYIYDNRYSLSLSIRNDAANLFGVNTNQKGVPLWSAGAAWKISNEKFYKKQSLPYLDLRATYGYNGNFSRATSALSTISFGTSFYTPAVNATIQNPPNKDLRWEQVRIMNIGLDFAIKNNVVTGTIDYYSKNSKDLIAPAPIDPTLGVLIGFGGTASVYRNIASMKGHGFELELNSRNIDQEFKWYTSFTFSSSFSKVTEYLMPVSANGSIYLNANSLINPALGKPVYALYGYYWAGLDPATGDPRGYLGKDISRDWGSITSNTKLDSLHYNGPAQPTYFGALRNTISWKNISLSFNISYKLGYYFRKPGVNYTSLFSNWTGNADYAKRWQNPGDENNTHVPSLVYPANNNRDNFYTYADVLIEKGDHIRLEDIRLDYTLDKSLWKKLPFRQVRLYGYADNLGVIWTANKDRIDPYFNNTPQVKKSITFGMNLIF